MTPDPLAPGRAAGTDETADPRGRITFDNAQVVYPNGTSADCGGNGSANGKYWYQKASGYTGTLSTNSLTGHRSGCTEIAFAGGDKLDGRVHFNDTPGIWGGTTGGEGSQATFTQGFETADLAVDTVGMSHICELSRRS